MNRIRQTSSPPPRHLNLVNSSPVASVDRSPSLECSMCALEILRLQRLSKDARKGKIFQRSEPLSNVQKMELAMLKRRYSPAIEKKHFPSMRFGKPVTHSGVPYRLNSTQSHPRGFERDHAAGDKERPQTHILSTSLFSTGSVIRYGRRAATMVHLEELVRCAGAICGGVEEAVLCVRL